MVEISRCISLSSSLPVIYGCMIFVALFHFLPDMSTSITGLCRYGIWMLSCRKQKKQYEIYTFDVKERKLYFRELIQYSTFTFRSFRSALQEKAFNTLKIKTTKQSRIEDNLVFFWLRLKFLKKLCVFKCLNVLAIISCCVDVNTEFGQSTALADVSGDISAACGQLLVNLPVKLYLWVVVQLQLFVVQCKGHC